MNFKRVIVTGFNGFIGSYLTKKLKELGYEVIPFSGDITKKCELPETDYLIHLAALTDMRECNDNPEKAMNVNVTGTLNILKAAKNIKKFIYMSTLGIYGNPEQLPLKEEGPVHPEEVYSLSKYFGELITKMYCKRNNIPFNIVRSFNVYGPEQRQEFAIPSIVKQAIDNNKLSLNNLNTTRDFFFIEDLIDGLISLIENGNPGEIYNFGSGKEIQIKEIINILEEILNRKIEINLKNKEPLVLRSQADITKAKQDLNWEPKILLKQGLQKMVDHYGKK